MSTETLSAPVSATSVGIEAPGPIMSAPSFGTEINTGGMHAPDLNANIFSQTSEFKIGSIDSFDKVVPGNLAFTHTETLWQASEKPAINTSLPPVSELENVLSQMESKDAFQTQGSEIELSKNAQSLLDLYISTLEVQESNTEDLTNNKELIADAEQASVVEKAWIAIGASEEIATESVFNALDAKLQKQDITMDPEGVSRPLVILASEAASDAADARPESPNELRDAGQASMAVFEMDSIKQQNGETSVATEAEDLLSNKQDEAIEENTDYNEKNKAEQAVETITQTQEEQELTKEQDLEEEPEMPLPIQTEEHFFEEDAKADKAREEYAEKAVEKAAEKVSKRGEQRINGLEIAEALPNNPQPDKAISEIIKARKTDGSYTEMTKQIAKSGEIDNAVNAKQIVEKAIQDNPAVRIASIKTSRSVTTEDVQRVLGEEVVLFKAK